MQQQFRQYIKAQFPFLYQEKLLLAISGGIDSVVLAHLCKKENLNFALAHCNYQLRGKDSDADEKFVRNLAVTMGVEVFVKRFNTRKMTTTENQSIQLVARDLRYAWFKQLCATEGYTYLLTAHHLNDNAETFFINLLRGTGLNGLTGIPPKNGHIIRPLSAFTQRDIEAYANHNKLSWREDQTNAADDYLRNRLRHHLVPVMVKENSDFMANFQTTLEHLKDSAALITDYQLLLERELSHRENGNTYFSVEKLKNTPHTKAVLYQLLHEYGFTAWSDIYDLLEAQPGKQVFSKTHRLLKDRKYLVLAPKNELKQESFLVHKHDKKLHFPGGTLICENVHKVDCAHNQIAYLAENKLRFPLILRRWKPGDIFQPFGMKGHKKISDFLKDEKLSLFEKENTWVLLSGKTVVWVVGHRIHHTYKIDGNTSNIFKIELR